jgi:hypothetical protein
MPRFMTSFSENGRQPQAWLPYQKPVLGSPIYCKLQHIVQLNVRPGELHVLFNSV